MNTQDALRNQEVLDDYLRVIGWDRDHGPGLHVYRFTLWLESHGYVIQREDAK